jgi:hypothetical protein
MESHRHSWQEEKNGGDEGLVCRWFQDPKDREWNQAGIRL